MKKGGEVLLGDAGFENPGLRPGFKLEVEPPL